MENQNYGEKSVDSVKDLILKDFQLATGWNVNLAYQAMARIVEAEEVRRPEILQYVLEKWGRIKQKCELPVPEVITREERRQFEKIYGDMADAMLKAYLLMGLNKGWTKENFYDELWRGIWGNIAWDNDKKRAFILYYIAIDVRIPYYPIGRGISIEKRERNSIMKKIIKEDYLGKFFFIDSMDWNDRIEQASQLIKLINNLDGDNEKSVFMSVILREYESRAENSYSEREFDENA